jgi:predicted nucleotidyltransferase
MLSPDDQEIARELRKRLSAVVKIEGFWVYGSRARGDATEDSDFDIYLVVEDLTLALRQGIDEVIWEVGFERDRVISAIVATREQVERGPFGANPLLRVIEQQGIPV